MQKTIVNITSNLLSRLPVQQMYYSTSDLSDAGFPTSLIERIHLEIEANLAESVQLPQSDWADMQTDSVQDAWSNFLSAIRAETRLPSSFARSVIETSVEDLLDLLSTPRNFIISTLFRNNQTASFDELTLRSRWVVAFPQLTSALLRYMQKKQLNVIPREKAEYVIAQVDDKLTEGYTPLKWGQHLEIMFNLLNNEVPSALLASFFEDRGMVSEARTLLRKSQTLSRSSFIDVLTGMSILDMEVDEHIMEEDSEPDQTDISVLSGIPSLSEKIETEVKVAHDFESSSDDILTDSDESDIEQPITLEEAFRSFDAEPDKTVVNEHAIVAETETADVTESDLEQEQPSILKSFTPESVEEVFEEITDEEVEDKDEITQEEATKEDEHIAPTNDKPKSILDAYLQDSEDADAPTTIEDTYDIGPFEPAQIHAVQDESEVNQTALFQTVKDDTEDEPALIDASSNEEDIVIYLTAASKKLLSYLEPNLDLFIVEIFLNDELDFYKHLENISSYNNWRMAGRYITRDIFDRNRIDLYSETAVLFTDTVQEYFDQLEH